MAPGFIALLISVGIVRLEEGPWLAKLLRDGGVIVTCGSVGVVRVSSRDVLLVLYLFAAGELFSGCRSPSGRGNVLMKATAAAQIEWRDGLMRAAMTELCSPSNPSHRMPPCRASMFSHLLTHTPTTDAGHTVMAGSGYLEVRFPRRTVCPVLAKAVNRRA